MLPDGAPSWAMEADDPADLHPRAMLPVCDAQSGDFITVRKDDMAFLG